MTLGAMTEGSSSPRVGISTALQASPARSTRSSREEHLSLSEGLLPIRTSPTHTAMPPAANRASLRAKWLVLRMCLVVFGIASCMVLVIDARQSRWVSKLMRGGTSGSQAPATPFEVTSCSLSPVHGSLLTISNSVYRVSIYWKNIVIPLKRRTASQGSLDHGSKGLLAALAS